MTNQPTNTAAIKALCKAQAAMPRAIKDADNPFFKTKYADLSNVQDACLPHLYDNGFAVIYRLGHDDANGYVETVLMHESGVEYSCPVPLIVDKQNMQGLGSAITYARRYGLMCLSGVAPEDDDGNSAAANPPKHRAIDNRPDNTNKIAVPPAEDPFRDNNPPEATDIDAAREIAKIQTITDIDELGGYWRVLKEAQKHIAKRPDVIAAKDDRKAVIGGKEAA